MRAPFHASILTQRLRTTSGFAMSLRFARFRFRFCEPPELALADHFHGVTSRGETSDFEQLRASILAGNLQCVGPAAYQDVGRRPWFRYDDRTRLLRRGNRF